MNDEVHIGNSLVLPLCCFHKHLSEHLLSGGWSDKVCLPFYQSGDVLLQSLLMWLSKAAGNGTGVIIRLSVPAIESSLASCIAELSRNNTVYVVTRAIPEGLPSGHGIRFRVDRHTCVSALLIEGDNRFITLTGPFSQSIRPGLHFHVLSTQPWFYHATFDAVRWP